MFEKFAEECKKRTIKVDDEEMPVSVAIGFARFDASVDKQYADVFNRADEAMYRNKRLMKEMDIYRGQDKGI